MNIQTPTQASTELVVVSALVPAEVFAPGGVEKIIQDVTDKVRAIETDISTPAGRKAISSLAYKVARSKTALDEMGKTLVASLKAQTNAIDAERRIIRERLDALQDEVRKPLTDWEDAEKARVAAHEAALADIENLPMFMEVEPTLDEIEERIVFLSGLHEGHDWQEFAKRASAALAGALSALTAMRDATKTREAERAEAGRLRREQAEREQRERDERIAREAAERARAEAERLARDEAARVAAVAEQERRRAEFAASEAARLAREATERAEREKVQAEARAAQAEADRIASEERARQRAEEVAEAVEDERVAAAAQAERDRQAAIQAERRRMEAAAEAAARAEADRQANKRHRAKINNAARDALVAAGLTAEQAVIAVTAIAKGDVPNVKISY